MLSKMQKSFPVEIFEKNTSNLSRIRIWDGEIKHSLQSRSYFIHDHCRENLKQEVKTDEEIPRCREILLMHSDCYENLKQEANAGEANHVATRKLSKHHQTTPTLKTTHAT